jgi:hypothetical protein
MLKMRSPDQPPGDRVLSRIPAYLPRNRLSWPIAALAALFVAGCGDRSPPAPALVHACAPDSSLTTTLHGTIAAGVEWGPDVLACEGMPRPEGNGARLRMSGPLTDAANGKTVAFILGIPALGKGMTARELPTNVTLIEEGSGRFFGTLDTSGCWTDVTRHEQVNGSHYEIRGTVYCLSPLAELNGGSSISFTELQFSSRLDWEPPK